MAVEPFHLFRYVDEQAFRYNHPKNEDGSKQFVFAGRRSPVDLQAINREGGAKAGGSFLSWRRNVRAGGNVALLRLRSSLFAAKVNGSLVFCIPT